jgi:5-methylcytosine-specific restriction endonuclease McrA
LTLPSGQESRKKPRLPHTDTHRTCYLCRRLLPNELFTRRSNGKYFSACKECNRAVFARRRAERIRQNAGSHTQSEWAALVARHERCPSCGRIWEDIPRPPTVASVITKDHIIPVALGGSDSLDNIRPLCYACNSKKWMKVESETGSMLP